MAARELASVHSSRDPRLAARRRGLWTRARGFTLVELLVVITIIGMLMALLLPAIQSAREAGRRNTCANNIRQCAIAMANFHDGKRHFPGYANVVAQKRASWVVLLLPYFERSDLYSMWVNNAGGDPSPDFIVSGTLLNTNNQNPWATSLLNILVCPSNPSVEASTIPNPLSYVVNCGSALTANDLQPPYDVMDPGWYEDVNSGVFFNQSQTDRQAGAGPNQPWALPTGGGPKVTMDFISTHDGTSNTLMLAENLQASTWAMNPLNATSGSPTPFGCDFQMKQNVGFVWFVSGQRNNDDDTILMAYQSNTNWNANRINEQAKNIVMPLAVAFDDAATVPMGGAGGLAFARPSSSHPGGVNTIFCDGHLRYISEDIGYRVYTQLMTPNQNACSVSYTATPLTPATWGGGPPNNWTYTLNEADY